MLRAGQEFNYNIIIKGITSANKTKVGLKLRAYQRPCDTANSGEYFYILRTRRQVLN